MEKELVTHAGIDYFGISAGKFRVNPLVALSSISKLFRGFWQSWRKIADFQPDVCLVTGGYVCPPVVAVCGLKRIPVLVYLPDMVPGWAIRGLSYPAKRVAISFPSVARFFGGEAPQGKAVVTGYPVRAGLVEAAADRAAARTQLAAALDRLSLADERDLLDGQMLPMVLIWGGSQGARSINRATWAMLAETLPHAHIVHVVGSRDWPFYAKEAEADVQTLPDNLRRRYHPIAYLHSEMTLALAAADVSIARAGASTLGEFPVAKLPSILVPLPFAGVNQASNADELAQRGGALIVQDGALSTALAPTLLALLANVDEREKMENSLGEIAMPNAALRIAQLLVEIS